MKEEIGPAVINQHALIPEDKRCIMEAALRSGVVIRDPADVRNHTRRMPESDQNGLRMVGWSQDQVHDMTPVRSSNPVLLEMLRLIRLKAVHRKGFIIGQVTPAKAVVDLKDEVQELIDALGTPGVMEELADVMILAQHLMILLGFTPEQLEIMMLNKLAKRFTVPNEPALPSPYGPWR